MNLLSILSQTVRYAFLGYIPLLLLSCTGQLLPISENFVLAESNLQAKLPPVQASLDDTMPAESQSYAGLSMSSLPGPYPTTLKEFLKYTSLIVVAELGDVEYFEMVGYDETGKLVEPPEDEPTMEMADFILKVEEVLWADKEFSKDEPIILRVMWLEDPEWQKIAEDAGFKLFTTGDRYLFMLALNPDGTYGVTYDENRLLVDDQGVLYYSQMAPPYPVKYGPFTEGERYSEERGTPLTVDDLVRAAQAKNGQ